ncbi:MAG: hypothetical protein GXO15_06800 [Crenarchaeota archaeon]|nr:hypothetical protein [Thermoproteota archaeon]
MTRRKYRSQAGIILDILEALEREGPLPATRLMYHANLPYNRLKETLARMLEEGLVEETGEKRYAITQRGREALRVLRESRRILESLGYRL